MARPVCRVRIPETLEQAFLFVVALLEALGLSLTNPSSAKITTWNDVGDQVEIAAATVCSAVLSGSLRNVNFGEPRAKTYLLRGRMFKADALSQSTSTGWIRLSQFC